MPTSKTRRNLYVFWLVCRSYASCLWRTYQRRFLVDADAYPFTPCVCPLILGCKLVEMVWRVSSSMRLHPFSKKDKFFSQSGENRACIRSIQNQSWILYGSICSCSSYFNQIDRVSNLLVRTLTQYCKRQSFDSFWSTKICNIVFIAYQFSCYNKDFFSMQFRDSSS